MSAADDGETRLDKWLWAARFFKTRALASAAVASGKIKVNGARAKPARPVRVGDELRIHIGVYEYCVHVRAVRDRRGSATEAALLYTESEASQAARKQLASQLAAERASAPVDAGRPSKRARRERIRAKQGSG